MVWLNNFLISWSRLETKPTIASFGYIISPLDKPSLRLTSARDAVQVLYSEARSIVTSFDKRYPDPVFHSHSLWYLLGWTGEASRRCVLPSAALNREPARQTSLWLSVATGLGFGVIFCGALNRDFARPTIPESGRPASECQIQTPASSGVLNRSETIGSNALTIKSNCSKS